MRKAAPSVSASGSRHNYKTRPSPTSPATRRGAAQEFEDIVARCRRQLMAAGAPYTLHAMALGLILLDHLNRTPGVCSTSLAPPTTNAPRWSCWPSEATLAAESKMSVRSVRVHLRALCDGPHALFVRRRPSERGARLYIHRGGKVWTSQSPVFELIEAPAALQAVRAARTAAQAAPAPHSAPNAAPAGSSVAEAAWSAYAAAYEAQYRSAPTGRSPADKRQRARKVAEAWDAARPGVPVPWERLASAYLASDESGLVKARHPFEWWASQVPLRLADEVAPVVDERQQAKRELKEAFEALDKFAFRVERLRPDVEVWQAVEAARAVEGRDGLRQAVEAVTGGGWKFRGSWGKEWLPETKAVREGKRWQDVPARAWQAVLQGLDG